MKFTFLSVLWHRKEERVINAEQVIETESVAAQKTSVGKHGQQGRLSGHAGHESCQVSKGTQAELIRHVDRAAIDNSEVYSCIHLNTSP
jgi:hypothetical protein